MSQAILKIERPPREFARPFIAWLAELAAADPVAAHRIQALLLPLMDVVTDQLPSALAQLLLETIHSTFEHAIEKYAKETSRARILFEQSTPQFVIHFTSKIFGKVFEISFRAFCSCTSGLRHWMEFATFHDGHSRRRASISHSQSRWRSGE
jgi:hypothetical protein